MANLKIELFGHELRNPVMPAAGPNSLDGEMLLKAVKGGAGGLVMKTISVDPAIVPRPNIISIKNNSIMNAELWSEIPAERYYEQEYAIAKSSGLFLMASVGYNSKELEKLGKEIERLDYVDAIEFSIHYLGVDFLPVINAAKALKKVTSVPILAKISPTFPSIKELVLQLDDIVDGYVAVNSFGPGLDFDINTINPTLGSENGYGWISGKALFPIALRIVYELSQMTNKTIIAAGGIYSGEDAIKMLMAGASAVQICSAVIEKGHYMYGKIANEINDWMDEKGYLNVDELIGLYSKKNPIATYKKIYPNIDLVKCVQCGKCVEICLHNGLAMKNKFPKVNEKCVHCGFCASICPTKAIIMK